MKTKSEIHFLLGMPRAATTYLYHSFDKHPNIFVPFRRKTNYFKAHLSKGDQWFLDHFNNATDEQVCVDTDTISFVDDESFEAFKSNYAGQKIILVIREPADWTISLYKQLSGYDIAMPTLNSYYKNGYTFIEDSVEVSFHFQPGDFEKRIQEIIDLFGYNLLLMKYEDFHHNILHSLNEIERFLEVPIYFNEENIIKSKINSSLRKKNNFLNRILRQMWLIKLLQLLPRNFVVWARKKFDYLSAKNIKNNEPVSHKVNEFDEIKSYYQRDYNYINNLFKNSSTILNPSKKENERV